MVVNGLSDGGLFFFALPWLAACFFSSWTSTFLFSSRSRVLKVQRSSLRLVWLVQVKVQRSSLRLVWLVQVEALEAAVPEHLWDQSEQGRLVEVEGSLLQLQLRLPLLLFWTPLTWR